ncbi:MAG: ferrochelatase [Alphaproteobacteria bacterium]|nr:ferrochelatase [Alphaproteobacteria bacterium]
MTLPPDHPRVAARRIGVLLVNLGTPDDPSVPAVRRYLAEFLSDRRVVEIPPLIWQPILRGVILNTRPKRSAAAYAKVWDQTGGDSPLRAITRDQAEALKTAFGDRVMVEWAMRYGQPSIADKLSALKEAGCDRILIAPLYPQYSAATTATVSDRVFDILKGWRWQPALRTLPPYHDDPAYIDAVAASLRAGLAALDFEPDVVLTSFHGMPERTLMLGDPYHCQCQKTARLLREAMGWSEDRLRISFQSRFGRAEWLKPYTDATLEALPGEGKRKVALIAPGFSADCLETLEEIAMEGAEIFQHAGGERFAYIPCLNASEGGVALLKTLLERELAGWI